MPNISEGLFDSCYQLLFMKEKSIVRGLSAGISPNRFCSVKIRRVGGQEPKIYSLRMPLAEGKDTRLFMIPCIVQNKKDLLRIIGKDQSPQKGPKGLTVAHLRKPVEEMSIWNSNRSKNMLGLLLPQTQNLGLMSHPRPSLKERRLQPKSRLIFKYQNPSFSLEFFLIPDRYDGPIVVATEDRPGPTSWWDAERKTPTGGESS